MKEERNTRNLSRERGLPDISGPNTQQFWETNTEWDDSVGDASTQVLIISSKEGLNFLQCSLKVCHVDTDFSRIFGNFSNFFDIRLIKVCTKSKRCCASHQTSNFGTTIWGKEILTFHFLKYVKFLVFFESSDKSISDAR